MKDKRAIAIKRANAALEIQMILDEISAVVSVEAQFDCPRRVRIAVVPIDPSYRHLDRHLPKNFKNENLGQKTRNLLRKNGLEQHLLGTCRLLTCT